jgi:hypothetical protein
MLRMVREPSADGVRVEGMVSPVVCRAGGPAIVVVFGVTVRNLAFHDSTPEYKYSPVPSRALISDTSYRRMNALGFPPVDAAA